MKNKQNIILAFFYLSLTLAILFLIFKFGISTAVTISELLQKGPDPSAENQEVILPPPQFFPIPEATNSATLPIKGYSLPNQKVDIYLNNLNIKTLEADSEGKFEDFLSLSLGENYLYGVTADIKDNQSPSSETWNIFYSNSQPYIEIINPPQNSVIKKTPNPVEISGKINQTSKATINGHFVVTSQSDDEAYLLFKYPVKLNPGENKIRIVCLDPAQNKTEIDWTLYYQP